MALLTVKPCGREGFVSRLRSLTSLCRAVFNRIMTQKESKDALDSEEYVVINISDLKKLRVHELKEKLSELGLPIKGTKAELIHRLEEHLSAAAESEEELALIDVANNSQPSDSVGTQECDKTENGSQKAMSFPDTSAEKSLLDTTYIEFSDNKDAYLDSPLKETSYLSQDDRMKARGMRFGVESSDDAKKAKRLEKFGSNSPSKISFGGGTGGGDLEKMKQRGERFGENVSKKLITLSDKDRQDSRKSRFSDGTNAVSATNKKLRLSTS